MILSVVNSCFVFLTLFIIIPYIIILKKRRSQYPPGPICFPKIGLFPYVIYKSLVSGSKFNQKKLFMHLKETYGDISSFSFGNQRFILLSSYELINEAFLQQKHLFRGRPKINGLELLTNDYKGIIFNDNSHWEENRRTTLKSLHALGIDKEDFNEYFIKQIDTACQDIAKHCDEPFDVEPILFRTFFKVMNSITFGYGIDESNTEWLQLYDTIKYLAQHDFMFLNVFWKYRSSVLMYFFISKFQKFEKESIFINKYFKEKVIKMLNEADPNSILNSYLDNQIEVDEITQSCMDLFLAGIDTVTSYMSAALLFLGRYKDYQIVMRTEIQSLEKKFGSVSFEHRNHLHYTRAFIEECHRFYLALPIFQHRVLEETNFHGFIFRPNDVIIGDQYSLNFNESVWDNPKNFNPYRFINREDGTFQPNKQLLTFGVGKRSCIGESISKVEILNTIVRILVRFNISLPKETMNNYDAIVTGMIGGIIHCPLPHTLLFSEN